MTKKKPKAVVSPESVEARYQAHLIKIERGGR